MFSSKGSIQKKDLRKELAHTNNLFCGRVNDQNPFFEHRFSPFTIDEELA